MEGEGLVRGLCEEATCPICLDYFKDPVIIPRCGHNFCKGCLDQYCGSATTGTCPQCRQTFHRRNIGANRQLANMVEMTRRLSLCGGEGGEGLCEQHQKPKHLFCKDDRTRICVTCERRDHRGHETLLLEEAAQEYMSQIQNRLEALREEKERILGQKEDTERECQGLLEQIKEDRGKTVKAFRQLRQFIDEQENLLLAQMEDAAKGLERVRENLIDNLMEELQSLEIIIQQMEEKLQEPAADLLQDFEMFMARSYQAPQSSENSAVSPSAVFKWRIFDFHDLSSFLEGVMEKFQDTFISGLLQQKANIHLDPETAHRNFIVSPDCKSLRWTDIPQDVPDNPERFDKWSFVLGHEEFTTGRHFWEVFVGSEEVWSVGVARKTMKRKGDITWGAEGGIWCMGRWEGEYRSSNMSSVLPLSEEPRKNRVTLNCEGGRVAFYDVDNGTLICEFPRGSFTLDNLQPFFYSASEAQLSLAF